jgi:Dolichyl-phosphate-mannose-protein mannosyltransferase
VNLTARNRIDVACALALSLFAAVLAIWAEGQFRQSRVRPDFYQAWFAPAVLFACGDGFRNADWSHDEALKAFLLRERDRLACGEVSRGLAGVPLDLFQRIALYLEWAVALTWRLAGVSWDAVSWVAAIMAAVFAAMVYGVMRLGMRPFAAATFSAVVVTSPLHLSYVPQLRDYSKAPFLLALVLLMGIAVQRSLSWRQWLTLSVLGGCVAGVGFGFRTDVLLAAVAFLATLFVFRAGSPSMRSRLMGGAAASAVFIAAFAVTAAPVLIRYAKGGTIGHVILLGFGEGFTAELGLEATHYELAIPYNDSYVETIVRSYASRVQDDVHLFTIGSEEYDR